MSDHNHEIGALGLGGRFMAMVDGEPLLGRNGKPRLFASAEAAEEAADLNAWCRDQSPTPEAQPTQADTQSQPTPEGREERS